MAAPVLIVEDVADDVELFRNVLRSTGVTHRLLVVREADEVFRYLTGQPPFSDRNRYPLPGVLVVDLKLPGHDGFEVVKWVRAQPELRDILVVVLSVSDDLPSIRRAYEAGANSFLAKPFNSVDLQNLVQAFPQHWTRQK